VKEGFQNHKLEAFITKMINLNNDIKNNQLIVYIFIFSYENIFSEFLKSSYNFFIN